MKKKMRVVIGLLLALVMSLSLAATAFADDTKGSITIVNPIDGATYHAYQMFDVTIADITGSKSSYSYTVLSEWAEFVSGETGQRYFTTTTVGDITYVSLKQGSSSDTAALAEAAVAYAKANSIGAKATLEASNSYTQDNLPLGYYVIDSSKGSLCALTTTNPNAVLREKNDVPTVDKEVKEDSTGNYGTANTAEIGQTVEFRTTVHAKPGAENYIVHDTMSSGLTFNPESVVVKIGETVVDAANYEVKTDELEAENPCTFHVEFKEAFLKTITVNTDIVIEYIAELNENAVIFTGANTNKTHLEYGDNNTTEEKSTKTETFKFDLVKTPGEGSRASTGELLAGAKFELYDALTGGNKINLVKVDDHTFRFATAAEYEKEDFVSAVIETMDDDVIVVQGVDVSTNYYLEEIEAPDGYNKLTERATVFMHDNNRESSKNIDKDGKVTFSGGVTVINNKGTELPSTGGAGTILFTFGGMILMIGAAVLLLFKRRNVVR